MTIGAITGQVDSNGVGGSIGSASEAAECCHMLAVQKAWIERIVYM